MDLVCCFVNFCCRDVLLTPPFVSSSTLPPPAGQHVSGSMPVCYRFPKPDHQGGHPTVTLQADEFAEVRPYVLTLGHVGTPGDHCPLVCGARTRTVAHCCRPVCCCSASLCLNSSSSYSPRDCTCWGFALCLTCSSGTSCGPATLYTQTSAADQEAQQRLWHFIMHC